MATTSVRKTLNQAAPAGATDTKLYTVPASTDTVFSGIVIAETSGAAGTIRVCADAAGGAITAVGLAIAWEYPITPNSVTTVGRGMTLAAGSTVIVRSSGGGVTFSAYGQENS